MLIWRIAWQALSSRDTFVHLMVLKWPCYGIWLVASILLIIKTGIFGIGCLYPNIQLDNTARTLEEWKGIRNHHRAYMEEQVEKVRSSRKLQDLEYVIVTFDAGILQSTSYSAIILRDKDGPLQEAIVNQHPEKDPLTAEAKGRLEAVLLVKAKQLQDVVILGDCKLIIDNLCQSTDPPWRVAHIISEIQYDLRDMVNISVGFIRRSLNVTAHEFCQWYKHCKLSRLVVLKGFATKSSQSFC
ncbi:hypothetical protein Ancab_033563 [Ancistrocladus abbreviatus]